MTGGALSCAPAAAACVQYIVRGLQAAAACEGLMRLLILGCCCVLALHCSFKWRCWHVRSRANKLLQLPLLVMLQHVWGELNA